MPRFTPLLALLIALTLAFSPVASVAMAKSCVMTTEMTTEMTADNSADCPCHDAMLDCGARPQCRTAAGCASQCFAACGVLPTVTAQSVLDHDTMKMAANARVSSLSIEPPAPPPRA